MARLLQNSNFINYSNLDDVGLSIPIIKQAIEYVYLILDAIDDKLIENNEPHLSKLIELANLSAVIGNLFRSGIAKASNGRFQANVPHAYPDLIAVDPTYEDLEIKIALENNSPKGHLVKPGLHIILRYVLGTSEGKFKRGKENRGPVVWIWEVRIGHLDKKHFSISNTKGDSGKTATINAEGIKSMKLIFCDLNKVPYSKNGLIYKNILKQY